MTWTVPARIETDRLTIRRYVAGDAEALASVAARNKDHLLRYMPWARLEPQTVDQRREYIATTDADFEAGRDYTMGVFDRATGDLLGGSGFHARTEPVPYLEIGYWIDEARQGEGLATEVAAALTFVSLEHLGSPFVGIVHAPTNVRSAAVPRRLGYVQQSSEGAATCTDGDQSVVPVEWRATAESLAAGPLASFARPTMFDAAGTEVPWSA